MATKLYQVEIPLRLAVEANNYSQARATMRKLYEEVMSELPTGAGCHMKDRAWEEVMRKMMEV